MPQKSCLALFYWNGSNISDLVSIILPFDRTSSQLPSLQKSKMHIKTFRNLFSNSFFTDQNCAQLSFKCLLNLQCSFNFEDITFFKGNDLLKLCHVWKTDIVACCCVHIVSFSSSLHSSLSLTRQESSMCLTKYLRLIITFWCSPKFVAPGYPSKKPPRKTCS